MSSAYLSDEAVQACPPSASYRLRKFARRNRGPVLAASLVLVVLVAGIIGTTWGMLWAKSAEADAVREAGEKAEALSDKERALDDATANEIRAKAAKAEAQENLKDALAAVHQMLTCVADDQLMYVPQMEPIRRDLLLDALKFYQKFLARQSDDPVIRRETALAHRRVGRIHYQLGQNQDAVRAYRDAIEMFDALGPALFAEPDFHLVLLDCHIGQSWASRALGNHEAAAKSARLAFEVSEKLQRGARQSPLRHDGTSFLGSSLVGPKAGRRRKHPEGKPGVGQRRA